MPEVQGTMGPLADRVLPLADRDGLEEQLPQPLELIAHLRLHLPVSHLAPHKIPVSAGHIDDGVLPLLIIDHEGLRIEALREMVRNQRKNVIDGTDPGKESVIAKALKAREASGTASSSDTSRFTRNA